MDYVIERKKNLLVEGSERSTEIESWKLGILLGEGSERKSERINVWWVTEFCLSVDGMEIGN